jgi:hypothetical protein
VDLSLNVEIFEAVDSGKVKDDSALEFISFSITDEPRPGNLVAIVSPAIFSEVEIVSMETILLYLALKNLLYFLQREIILPPFRQRTCRLPHLYQ